MNPLNSKYIKNVYIIRHGETDFNKNDIMQGKGIDSNLNERGYQQALLFYQAYKDLKFDKIYTSCQKRSIQTVQYFIDDGIEYESLYGLNELGWGIYEGRTMKGNVLEHYQNLIHQWTAGNLNAASPNGESPTQVSLRQQKALKHILAQNKEKNVLICMHGRAIRIFLCLLTKTPLQKMNMFLHQNLSLYQLGYTGQTFEILLHNDLSHLKNIGTC